MEKSSSLALVGLALVSVFSPATAQETFCSRDQWANADQVQGASALVVHIPDIVTTFWSDLSASDLTLSDRDQMKLTDIGNKLTDTLFTLLMETAGVAAVLRSADEARINQIMDGLQEGLAEMSGREFSGPTTYAEFRRVAIRCVASYDG